MTMILNQVSHAVFSWSSIIPAYFPSYNLSTTYGAQNPTSGCDCLPNNCMSSYIDRAWAWSRGWVWLPEFDCERWWPECEYQLPLFHLSRHNCSAATTILNEITKTSGVSTVSVSTSNSTLGLPSPFYSEKVCISVAVKVLLVSFLSGLDGLHTRSGKAFSFQNFFGQ